MTNLAHQIEQMRSRVEEIARSDKHVVETLADALERADEELLNDVVELAQQHEARRGVILKELQALARRLGTFPRPIGASPEADLPPLELRPRPTVPSSPNGSAPGDWRGLLIEDELANLRRRRAS